MISFGQLPPPCCDDCQAMAETNYVAEFGVYVCEACEQRRIGDQTAPGVPTTSEEAQANYLQEIATHCDKLEAVLRSFAEIIADLPADDFTNPAAARLMGDLRKHASFWTDTADALQEAASQSTEISHLLINPKDNQ